MSPSLVTRAVLLCLLLDFGNRESLAQGGAANQLETVPLEKVPDRLTKSEEAWGQQINAVKAIVDQEEAAKRITESVAQSLRWSLRNAMTASQTTSSSLTSAKVPSENAALTKAFRELETAQQSNQTDRTLLLEASLKEIRDCISKLMREASSVAEVDKLIASVEAIERMLQKRGVTPPGDLSGKFTSSIVFLGQLRRLVEAEASGDVAALSAAMNDLRQSYLNRDVFSEVERRKRLDLAIKPYRKAEEEAQQSLESALESGKKAGEISAALSQYVAAAEKLRAIQGPEGRSEKDPTPGYRALLEYRKAVELGDLLGLKRKVDQARSAAIDIGGTKGVKLEEWITSRERELVEQEKKVASVQAQNLRNKMAAAKKAADVDAIINELQNPENEIRRGAEANGTMPILPPLTLIANAWKTNNPSMLQKIEVVYTSSLTEFEAGLNELKLRALRDITARVLRAPELTQAPLSEKPLRDAIDSLCDDLTEKREWRRLLQIFEYRASAAGSDSRQADDSLNGIRAYFVAQNFELAELWSEAAESYRAVLRSTSQRVPVAEAAERLKKLIKEHPELNEKEASGPAAKANR